MAATSCWRRAMKASSTRRCSGVDVASKDRSLARRPSPANPAPSEPAPPARTLSHIGVATSANTAATLRCRTRCSAVVTDGAAPLVRHSPLLAAKVAVENPDTAVVPGPRCCCCCCSRLDAANSAAARLTAARCWRTSGAVLRILSRAAKAAAKPPRLLPPPVCACFAWASTVAA